MSPLGLLSLGAILACVLTAPAEAAAAPKGKSGKGKDAKVEEPASEPAASESDGDDSESDAASDGDCPTGEVFERLQQWVLDVAPRCDPATANALSAALTAFANHQTVGQACDT